MFCVCVTFALFLTVLSLSIDLLWSHALWGVVFLVTFLYFYRQMYSLCMQYSLFFHSHTFVCSLICASKKMFNHYCSPIFTSIFQQTNFFVTHFCSSTITTLIVAIIILKPNCRSNIKMFRIFFSSISIHWRFKL